MTTPTFFPVSQFVYSDSVTEWSKIRVPSVQVVTTKWGRAQPTTRHRVKHPPGQHHDKAATITDFELAAENC